jgi:NAD(P) transhydrogenase subunit alpha
MSPEYQKLQAELVAAHIAKQDIVVTTALIPGRAAPVLVTEAMVRAMRPGSVIIDLAVSQGGNCQLSKPDEIVDVDGVKVAGFTNLPGRVAADSSALYARNLLALLPLLTGENAAFRAEVGR